MADSEEVNLRRFYDHDRNIYYGIRLKKEDVKKDMIIVTPSHHDFYRIETYKITKVNKITVSAVLCENDGTIIVNGWSQKFDINGINELWFPDE